MTFPFPFFSPVVSASPPVLTYQTSAVQAADATTYNFTSQAIGTAAADRYVIVTITGCIKSGSPGVSAVTVGGISATIVAQVDSGFTAAAIAIAAVPTGTTATVVVTFNGTQYRAGIGVYSVTGLNSSTATGTDTDTTSSPSLSASSSSDGFAIAVSSAYEAATTNMHTWTSITEDYDELVESGTNTQSGASEEGLSSGTFNCSVAFSGSPTAVSTVLATFR